MALSRKTRTILVALALVAAPLAAQRPAARWPLASIRVEGNRVYSDEAIARAAGLKIGAAINAADLERAAGRLTEAGAFESLSFRYEPVDGKFAVTFEVQEVVDLYPVGFQRLGIPDAELMKMLDEKVPLFGPQVPATGRMVKRIIEAIESYLAARNRGGEILGRLLPGRGGELVMTFHPAETLPSITFVKFQGSAVLRDVDLQKVFYQVAVGVPYTEARVRELLDHNIRPLFEEKGRLRVRFGPITVEESKEPEGVVVTVPVEDGEEFKFGGVKFAGNTRIPEKELGRLAKLPEGEMANFALVNQAGTDIERLYRRNGFMNVKAAAERTVDDEKKTVDLLFRVQEGNQYKFRKLEIKGIDINAIAAVRRRWGIQPGQPFDGSYAELFIQRIQEEAMFERLAKISPRISVDEATRMVDVELVFHAEPIKKPRYIP